MSVDYPSRQQQAQLLLYPCAGAEIAQLPFRRRRSNLVAIEAFATAMVPNVSKKIIENNVLTIHGERKFSEETRKENYRRVERNVINRSTQSHLQRTIWPRRRHQL